MSQSASALPSDFRSGDPTESDGPATVGEGVTSFVLFTVIAALMATDLVIEYRRGVSMALQTFELLIFLSALAGIAFHWSRRVIERHRSRSLDIELAAARAEA